VVSAWVTANGLTPHPDKTKVDDRRQPGQGLDFLGYRFETGMRFVRDKGLNSFLDKRRVRTIRGWGDGIERIVAEINPMLSVRPRTFYV